MAKAKVWYKSKTIWINILLFVGGAATMLGQDLQSGAPLTIAAVANVLLRAITKTPVSTK